MKKFKLLLAIALTSVVVACGGSSDGGSGSQESEEVVSYEGMTKLNLREYGFEGTIYIPNEDFGQPIVERTDWGSVKIAVGQRFGIELQQEPMSYDMRKSEVMEAQVFETELLEDEPPMLVWKNTIPESGIEPEHHFFYLYSKDNFNVSISSFLSEQYSKSAIDKMVIAAKSYDHLAD